MKAFAIADGVHWCQLCATVRQDIGQQQRYRHSIQVARTAELLAMQHGLDPKRARIAGLLHDLARLWSTERLLAACKERNYPITAFEQHNPIVLHAPIGAALARECYGVDDPAILQAIERHTLGAYEMTPLDTIIFLADALEPGRRFAQRKEYFVLAMRDLDAALFAVYSTTKIFLEQQGLSVAPQLEAGLARLTAKGSPSA